MNRFNSAAVIVAMAGWAFWSTAHAQTPDPVIAAMADFTSPSVLNREYAFYGLLSLGASNSPPPGHQTVVAKLAAIRLAYPADSDTIVTGLVSLLQTENAIEWTGGAAAAAAVADDYGDYYADLVGAVATLNDPRIVPALVPAVTSGTVVSAALAQQGPAALGPLAPKFYSTRPGEIEAAAFVLVWMLKPANIVRVSDAASQSTIRAMLSKASSTSQVPGLSDYLSKLVTTNLPPAVPGDVSGDGVVDCADLGIILAAFHKKVGQQGFDIRADLNGDGIVNGKDVLIFRRFVHRRLACDKCDKNGELH